MTKDEIENAIRIFDMGEPDPLDYVVAGHLFDAQAQYRKACLVIKTAVKEHLIDRALVNDEIRKSYQRGEQDAAERLALMFEHYGHERAAKDIRDRAREWPLPAATDKRADGGG